MKYRKKTFVNLTHHFKEAAENRNPHSFRFLERNPVLQLVFVLSVFFLMFHCKRPNHTPSYLEQNVHLTKNDRHSDRLNILI